MENEKSKFRVNDVYYRTYYDDNSGQFYTDPDRDRDTAKARFDTIKSQAGKSVVTMVRVIETEEIIEEK